MAKDDSPSVVDSTEIISCCGREDEVNVEISDRDAEVDVVSRGDDACVVLVERKPIVLLDADMAGID